MEVRIIVIQIFVVEMKSNTTLNVPIVLEWDVD